MRTYQSHWSWHKVLCRHSDIGQPQAAKREREGREKGEGYNFSGQR